MSGFWLGGGVMQALLEVCLEVGGSSGTCWVLGLWSGCDCCCCI